MDFQGDYYGFERAEVALAGLWVVGWVEQSDTQQEELEQCLLNGFPWAEKCFGMR